jgi:drug/metabolite transporter (DMT)-like permease
MAVSSSCSPATWRQLKAYRSELPLPFIAGLSRRIVSGRLNADRASPLSAAAPYVALVLASVLWGSLYTAGKPAVAVTGPVQVTLCRVVLACACLVPLVVARGGTQALTRQFRRNWRAILTLGVLNFCVSQLLALSALEFLPASVNGVLNNTHPLWVALGTAFWYPSRRPVWLVGGSLIALAGVALVFLPDLLNGAEGGALSNRSGIGVALSLAGSGVIALGTVLGRRVMRDGDPLAVTALASAAAIVPVSLLTVTSGGVRPILDAPASIVLLLVYLGVGCTAANFALWYYGLKHLSAAGASAFQYLIPPVGVALAAVFLGEPVTPTLLAGTLLVLIGLVATQLAAERSS